MRGREKEHPTVIPVIILTLIALAFFVVTWREETWPISTRLWLALGGIIFLALAITAAALWIQYNRAVIEEQRNKAWARSERVLLLEQVAKMSPDQMTVLQQYVPTLELIAGDGGPMETLRVLEGQTVPYEFVKYYINLGTTEKFYPIRNLDKRAYQDWAKQFIDYAVVMGWARSFAGNQPAEWIDYNRAISSLWRKSDG